MTNITITIQSPTGEILNQFSAKDKKSITQMAKESQFYIPLSCNTGMCGICKAKIIKGNEFIQIDKISAPMKPLNRNEAGEYTEIFTCIAGIKSKFFNDGNKYEIILEKHI